MEKAVDNLEAMFKKAETDLNFLSRKLQMENGQALKEENNPIELIKKIEEIKSEYTGLQKDISDIQAAQKETVDFFQTMVANMTQMLAKLETQCESSEPELADSTRDLCEELSELMGVPVQTLLPLPANIGQSMINEIDGAATVSVSESSITLKPASKRQTDCLEFVEVTHDEFMSVSNLKRGKAKLEDVNRTYKILWQHFKEGGKREALTPKEMNSMGLRVFGATGEAKLKVLQALKLCQISKNGDVKLT